MRRREECADALEKAKASAPGSMFRDRAIAICQQDLDRWTSETAHGMLAKHKRDEAASVERERQAKDDDVRRVNAARFAAWNRLIEDRGKRYDSCRLTNYEVTTDTQRNVLDRLREYANSVKDRVSSGDGIILIGPSGTGKDHLLTGLARVAIGLDITVAWTSGVKLFRDSRDAIATGDQETLIRNLSRVQVLILSDLIPPAQRLTDFQAETIYAIADERYNRALPTWLSVNVANREAMESAIGVPVVDRLAHGAIVLACDWPSYRKPDGKKP